MLIDIIVIAGCALLVLAGVVIVARWGSASSESSAPCFATLASASVATQ